MSVPGTSKTRRPMTPLPKDYHRTVSEMETNNLLRSTFTDDCRTQKGDQITCLFCGLSYFWRPTSSLSSSCTTSRRLVRTGSLLCVWMGRARVLSYWSRKSFPGCSVSCVRLKQSMTSWKTLGPLLNPSGYRSTWWEMYRLQRWSGTSPSFVIVLTTFLRWSPGLSGSRSHLRRKFQWRKGSCSRRRYSRLLPRMNSSSSGLANCPRWSVSRFKLLCVWLCYFSISNTVIFLFTS